MLKFIVLFNESGNVEVRNQKAINKYDLDVPFDNFETEESEEVIYLKGSSEVKSGETIERWHCFKLLDYFNRGHYRHHNVEYLHSEERSYFNGEVIKKYNVNSIVHVKKRLS